MIVDITDEELEFLNSCIYMAYREGFYDYGGTRDKIKLILIELYNKLGYNQEFIDKICDKL